MRVRETGELQACKRSSCVGKDVEREQRLFSLLGIAVGTEAWMMGEGKEVARAYTCGGADVTQQYGFGNRA